MTLDPRITFSRASLGTYYGSAGVLKYAAHNYIWPSEDLNAWSLISGATVTVDNTTAPNGTMTADRFNHPLAGATASATASRGAGLSAATSRCVFSVYAKAGTKGWLLINTVTTSTASQCCYFNLTTGVTGVVGTNFTSSGISDAGNGWWRCWALTAAVPTLMVLRVGEADNNINSSAPGDIYIWGAQAEQVTTATTPSTYLPTTTAAVHGPRLDYDPVTHVAKGLLIEGARNNELWWAQDLSNAVWTKTGATIAVDQIVAPDGTTTADRVTASASPATISESPGSTGAAINYAASIYAKKGTSDWIYLIAQVTASTPRVWFNLATGAVGTVESPITSATIQDVGNGWYHCKFLRPTAAGNLFVAGICDGDNSTTVTVGRTVHLWGAQLESLVAPDINHSSYIPTAGADGVRAADVAVMTGSNFSSWYNAAAGTFVAEFDLFSTAGNRGIIIADQATAGHVFRLYGVAGVQMVNVVAGAGLQADINLGALAVNTPYKVGLSYAVNDFAACLNGGTVVTDTSGVIPTVDKLRIGTEISGTNYLNGHIRRIRFFNVAKTDAELQALTT